MLAHKRHLARNHDIHAGAFAIHQRGQQQRRALQASRISRYSVGKFSTITNTAHTPRSKLHPHQMVLSSVNHHRCPCEQNSVIQGLNLVVSSAMTILQNARWKRDVPLSQSPYFGPTIEELGDSYPSVLRLLPRRQFMRIPCKYPKSMG